ncbi:MAG: hypothetical protein JJE13_06630 [Thermoleophilia bacterium]|nr:hypothetical protein [Thermoleophilia bacterium]
MVSPENNRFLANARIGVSVSESSDLARLGLTETHLRLTLGEIARMVLLADSTLVYGGRIDASGYTSFLSGELERFGQGSKPLVLCLAWSEHRTTKLSELSNSEEKLKPYGVVTYLDPNGNTLDPSTGRGEEPVELGDDEVSRSLSGLRNYMIGITNARILVGGKRSGFQGEIPGLLEEAKLAINADQPLYLAGGFGGITADLADSLGLGHGEGSKPPSREPIDSRAALALRELAVEAEVEWEINGNGLSRDDNVKLSNSVRPGEVASLIGAGLRRISASQEWS